MRQLIITTIFQLGLLIVSINSEFITEKEAKATLARRKRNNEATEWSMRSSLERECIEEDCNFEEFGEDAENLQDTYGAIDDDNKDNLLVTFTNFYTENGNCNVKNSESGGANLNSEREECLKLVAAASKNGVEWQDCSCLFGDAITEKKCYTTVESTWERMGFPGSILSQCQSCNVGYHKVENKVPNLPFDGSTCKRNICNCNNGTSAIQENCIEHQMDLCTSCDAGYYKTESKTCDLKVCSCQNGTPSKGLDCPNHGDKSCEDCDQGFHWEGKKKGCKQNVCKCPNGYPATGSACTQHNSQNCVANPEISSNGFSRSSAASKCFQFFIYENGKCNPSCECENGEAATGSACQKHINKNSDNELCAKRKCDKGYHFSNGKCEQNVCKCPKGTEATGSDCAVHNSVMCESCDRGFYEKRWKCLKNKCTCKNGRPAMGRNCHLHNSEKCLSCNSANFVLTRGMCLTKEKACKQAPLDLVFLIDGSHSVEDEEFEKQVRFLLAMTKKFDVSADAARIGLVQYNYKPYVEFHLLADSDEIGVELTNLSHRKGGTRTGKALKFVYDKFFKDNDRVGANKAIVVITDGKSSDRVDKISEKLSRNGVNVLALGYNTADKAQLLQITGGDEDKVFQGQTVSSLTRFNNQLVRQICNL